MIQVAVAILQCDNTILVCQRKRGSRYELKWEFPGGKLEPGESVEQALRRELREELSITVHAIDHIDTRSARYDDGGVYDVAYCRVSGFDGVITNNVFEDVRWVTLEELRALDILEGNRVFVQELRI